MRTWCLIVGVTVGVSLPFFLIGEGAEAVAMRWLAALDSRPEIAAVVLVLLLATDVVLPVPSSVVSIAGGALLGVFGGTATSVAGMTLSCVFGYWLGRSAAPAAQYFAGMEQAADLRRAFERLGDWFIVVGRAVPVLAESTTVVAGISGMPFRRFMAMSSLANLGISVVYACVGAFAVTGSSFVLAFSGAVVIPLAAMVWFRRTLGRVDDAPR